MSLQSSVFGLLDNAQRLCRPCVDAADLSNSLKEMRTRLETPLRVAVVGIMKAGKSTFMNALMGADILCTGNLETTYTVCWFRYGKQPKLTICFRNGKEQDAPISDLARWSVRTYEKENPRINDVKYLVIHYPSEVLKTMEFIDTPGLNSMYRTDAKNTLDFLSIQGSEETIYEAGMADAIIYAFSHTASGFDEEILQEFHKGGMESVSPINSVGILTKVDATGIWDIFGEASPVETAKTVTSTVMKNEGLKRLLFTVLPVCAKVCEGCAQLDPHDWDALRQIAKVDAVTLQDLLFDAEQFAHSEEEVYTTLGTTVVRTRLMGLIGQYGILEIANFLRSGKTPEETAIGLQSKCGVQAVRDLLLSHFGNRTFLIKSQFIFNRLQSLVQRTRKRPEISPQLRDVCAQILDSIDALMTSVQTLKELKALQMYYNGQLQFSSEEERQDFLRITGEYGRSAEARLGVEGALTVAELAGIARDKVALWHGKTSDWVLSSAYMDAASIIARSYEQMCFHLNSLSEE